MKKFKIYNIGCFVEGEKVFATNSDDDFAKKFAASGNDVFFTVNSGDDIFKVPKRNIFFIARSVLNSVNEILEQNLHILVPTQNVRLVHEILATFSSFTKGLLNENDAPNNSFDAWLTRFPEKNVH